MLLNTLRFRIAQRCSVVAIASVLLVLPVVTARAADETVLTIGSNAPELNIEHWFSNGKGAFKPVTKFEKGKVYVVEFWATWCGPCVGSMPHLVQLQQKHGKNVQIISISDEDPDTVKGFLAGEYRGQGNAKTGSEPKTYAELTSAYCLTADPDRSCYQSYMKAAVQGGIPCAFIVGKDQKIEYIGHPVEMDEALSKVIDGNWDRKAFAEEFQPMQNIALIEQLAETNPAAAFERIEAMLKTTSKVEMKLQLTMMKVGLLNATKKHKQAVALIDAAIQDPAYKNWQPQLQMHRVQLVMSSDDVGLITETANAIYKAADSDPQLIGFVAWTIAQLAENGAAIDKGLIKSSLVATQAATNKLEGDYKASSLDTLAHLQFLGGDKAAAIKTQEEAISSTKNAELKAQLTEYLKKLKAESK